MTNDLLSRLNDMVIEPAGSALTFPKRLARENGWAEDFAARVVDEYRRFLYLTAVTEQDMTPSDEVDQAWHLHMLYSRHYWDVLCKAILKRPLHHGPTQGGAVERTRYHDQYEATIDAYRTHFGAEPPRDIWPVSKRRFGARYQRVDVSRYWMFPKIPSLKTVGFVVPSSLLLAACSSEEVASNIFILVLVAAALIGTSLIFVHFTSDDYKDAKDKKDEGGCGGFFGGGDRGDSSGCGGGCGGCGG
jgi:hypothetical protein